MQATEKKLTLFDTVTEILYDIISIKSAKYLKQKNKTLNIFLCTNDK
jgi:hypothetical protein